MKKQSRQRKLSLKVETLRRINAGASSDKGRSDLAPNTSQESYCPVCDPDMTSTYN